MLVLNNKRAFTLIELLVVVAIIGILAAVGVVAYNGYTKIAKIKATQANHKLLVNLISAKWQMCNVLSEVEYNINGTKNSIELYKHGQRYGIRLNFKS